MSCASDRIASFEVDFHVSAELQSVKCTFIRFSIKITKFRFAALVYFLFDMIAVLFESLLAVLGVWLLHFWWSNRNFFRLAAKIPQIEGGWPLIGHAPIFFGVNNKGAVLIVKSKSVSTNQKLFCLKSHERYADALFGKNQRSILSTKALAGTSTHRCNR